MSTFASTMNTFEPTKRKHSKVFNEASELWVERKQNVKTRKAARSAARKAKQLAFMEA